MSDHDPGARAPTTSSSDSSPAPTAAGRPGRRQVLGAALGAVGASALAACASVDVSVQAAEAQGAADPFIHPGDTVLFQGDSITDGGRDRDRAEANDQPALGGGYAWLAAAGLLVDRPDDRLRVFNRGISGNKVFQLADRWDDDCIALKPDVVSILIGVNDVWHKRTGGYDGTVEVYEQDYERLLARTRGALPGVRLVVCEPFVLPCGAVDESWFPEFDGYRAAARRVAREHNARFVPFHSMFEEAARIAPPEHWAADGVHPTPAGAALMAQAWLEVVS